MIASVSYRTFLAILTAMIDHMVAAGSAITDFSVGSPVRTLLEAVADEIDRGWFGLRRSDRAAHPETAIGTEIDKHGVTYGVTRLAATPSSGMVRFLRTEGGSGDKTIPAETRCSTNSGIAFATDAEATLEDGDDYVDVAATCEQSGTSTNVGPNSVTVLLDSVDGVAGCNNTGRMSGGSGEESDEAMRTRIKAMFGNLAPGAQETYETWPFLASSEITRAHAVHDSTVANKVWIYITGLSGEAASALEDTVQDYVDPRRALTSNVVVASATVTAVNVTCTARSDGTRDSGDIEDDIEDALNALLDWRVWTFGADVTVAALTAAIISVEGVSDVAITVPAATVAMDEDELPKLGVLDLTVEE